MNKKLEKFLLYAIPNLFIILCCCGYILFTLTYTQVPVTYQHYWFGNNLHEFLVFEHALTTGIMLFGNLIATTCIAIKTRAEIKEDHK